MHHQLVCCFFILLLFSLFLSIFHPLRHPHEDEVEHRAGDESGDGVDGIVGLYEPSSAELYMKQLSFLLLFFNEVVHMFYFGMRILHAMRHG